MNASEAIAIFVTNNMVGEKKKTTRKFVQSKEERQKEREREKTRERKKWKIKKIPRKTKGGERENTQKTAVVVGRFFTKYVRTVDRTFVCIVCLDGVKKPHNPTRESIL
jgi:tRNA G18 (ribose-2'-O)-methylase SpoU